MSSRFHRLAVTLAASTLAACAATAGDGVEQEGMPVLVDSAGDVITANPTLRGLSVRDGVRAEVTVGAGPASLSLTADANLFDRFIARVDEDGYLDVRSDGSVEPMVPPVLRLSVTELDYVSAKGDDSSVTVTGRAGADRFGIGAIEGGSVTVDGACEELQIIASGGTVEAGALECARGMIDAQGGADVRAQLSESVTVTASGESQITVSGDPAEVTEALTDDSVLTLD